MELIYRISLMCWFDSFVGLLMFQYFDLTEKNINTYRQLHKIAEEKYTSGKSDNLEYLQAKQSLLSEENTLISLETSRRELESSLRNILNIGPEEKLNLTYGDILKQNNINVDINVPLSVLANRPDLIASQYRLEKAFKNLEAEEKNWYPNISGVARSLNYYPIPGQKSEDGVGMLSFGLGKTIVDEGTALRFCPAKPRMPSDSLSGESSVQSTFYALSLKKPFNPEINSDNLIQLPIENEIKNYPEAFRGIASTLDVYTGMLSESMRAEGIKMLTFNGVLKYETIPLAKAVHDMLQLGTNAMAEPVEIEFAVNTEHEGRPDFSILQIRPISGTSGYTDVPISEDDRDNALIFAEKVMGNGIVEDVREIITIKPDAFDRKQMVDMARELEILNKEAEGSYVLIAAGRLGSSDRWLGIPCTWSQISKAHVIVETGLKDLQVEPSQGTHFFQNMTSLGCIYLTINPLFDDGIFRYEEIAKLPVIRETEHFLAVKAPEALVIKANGLEGKAVIRL